MKIGLIVDGQSEVHSLDLVLRRAELPNEIIEVLYSDIQPYAPTPQIVRAMDGNIRILADKQADMIIALIDREDRAVCPGQWAAEIAQDLNKRCSTYGIQRSRVVIKDSCYENWLISDPSVFRGMPKRFTMSDADIEKIISNNADRVDAQHILKRAAIKRNYSKVGDAKKIMDSADPLRMAANSRSFRKLLRELGHPKYRHQSRSPAR
ncbi:MAG TPA: DUF4276 family protein [Chloroflexia bacterium]|jgi:hypothetical protein